MEAEYHFVPDFKQITAFKMVEVEWGVGMGGGDWGWWGLDAGIREEEEVCLTKISSIALQVFEEARNDSTRHCYIFVP